MCLLTLLGFRSSTNYYIWEFETGELVRKFDRSGHKVEIVDWTPDGKYLATAGNDPFIRFFQNIRYSSGPSSINSIGSSRRRSGGVFGLQYRWFNDGFSTS